MFFLGVYLSLDQSFPSAQHVCLWPIVTVQTGVGQEDGGVPVRGMKGCKGAVKHVGFPGVRQGPQEGFK